MKRLIYLLKGDVMRSELKFARRCSLYLLMILIFTGCKNIQASVDCKAFEHWPEGTSPQEIGKRVAENFLARKFDFEVNRRREYVIYPEVCTWYGALNCAKLSKDKDLQEKLIRHFDRFFAEDANRISPNAHVDYRVFGAVPLEIYLQTKNKKYLTLGKGLADKQWAETTDDGITREARYWIDDMYMISAVQTQAYRATGDMIYLDRSAMTMVAYLEKLQQDNGLFLHAEDSPFFWGRGNGWQAAGITELLRALPKNHPHYERIMKGYITMMEALLKYQGDDGMWRQLVDKSEAWPETSGTGMFTYAMVTGVKKGWLDPEIYGPAARKAWLALVGYIDEDANVTNVCVGTNKAFKQVGADLKDQYDYYLARDRKTGDLHGQAPVLWTASAFMR